MHIAVIGGGLAGLTSAKQALAAGYDVVVYEKTSDVGGIWNPASGGAYEAVRMQSSRMSFPFSDYPPAFPTDFPTLAEVHEYLRGYARHFGVAPLIRFDREVVRVARTGQGWTVEAQHPGGREADLFDAVMVANGELWTPRMPSTMPAPEARVRVVTAKDYRRPADFRGRRVLVVGGGVSGADIASELTTEAASVDWSVRHRALFLPRDCGGVYNDALFSYVGRSAVEELPYGDYLAILDRIVPGYMAAYRATGLLPESGFHNAVHINEKIVPLVHSGAVQARPAFDRFTADGSVVFTDGATDRYDAVVLCLGYEMPDYGFIEDFRREDLYEHHFYRHDPTLAVVNTPVDTEAFGTACPYFEAIAGWVLSVLAGKTELPDAETRAAWCDAYMSRLHDRRFFDCWRETVRIGLLSRSLPDPETAFADYWSLVSSVVTPANLRPTGITARPAAYDELFDLAGLKHRVLASLTPRVRATLLATAQISEQEHRAAAEVPAGRALAPWLPYRERA